MFWMNCGRIDPPPPIGVHSYCTALAEAAGFPHAAIKTARAAAFHVLFRIVPSLLFARRTARTRRLPT